MSINPCNTKGLRGVCPFSLLCIDIKQMALVSSSINREYIIVTNTNN